MYVSAGSDADSDDLADALMLDMEKGVSWMHFYYRAIPVSHE